MSSLTPKSFPAAVYIEHIRKCLWNSRETGRAAVMVGSGFSRNAVKLSPVSKDFPLWRDLTGALGEPLGLTLNEAADIPITRLASQYENSFQRQSLDDLIERMIPWKQYTPGHIHELLLSLPWADVFTTNYDTLLEDTRKLLVDRKYDLVTTASDLPNTQQPRIVKLHGSFPSQKPFIFTEEDFRKYPRDFAPFVNLVQESMMENAFILLGFSGEDPNFHRWAGWVQDELGDLSPNIYLCGLLDLTEANRRYLESKKITPIDLSQLFPRSEYPDKDERNSKALEWLLISLHNGRSGSASEWPVPISGQSLRNPTFDYPEPLAVPRINKWKAALDYQAELSDVFKNWNMMRKAYPGWETCPYKKRETLWLYLDIQIKNLLSVLDENSLFALLKDLNPVHRFMFLYEYTWLLDKAQIPMYDLIEIIKTSLMNVNPFPKHLEIKSQHSLGESITIDHKWQTEEEKYFDWSLARQKWIDMYFWLVRELKDLGDSRYEAEMEILSKIVEIKSDWKARWCYEYSQFYINNLLLDKCFDILKIWPKGVDIIWDIRKASILLEVDRIEEAKSFLMDLLDSVRQRLDSHRDSYKLLSQEGMILKLLEMCSQSILRSDSRDMIEMQLYQERLSYLKNFQCDPDISRNDIKVLVRGVPSKLVSYNEEYRFSFDTGIMHRSRHYRSDIMQTLQPSFNLMFWGSRSGFPFKSGYTNVFNDKILSKAAEDLFDFNPFMCTLFLVRHNLLKSIELIFTKSAILRMDNEFIDRISDVLINALVQGLNFLENSHDEISKYSDILVGGIEVISRLTIRLDSNKMIVINQFIINCMNSKNFSEDFRLTEALRTLMRRFFRMNVDIDYNLAEYLSLPLKPIGDVHADVWLEPVLLELPRNTKSIEELKASNVGDIFQSLIKASTSTDISRKNALMRLYYMQKIGLLNKEQQKELEDTLWLHTDNYGLPAHTWYQKFNLIYLSDTRSIEALQVFKQYLKSGGLIRLIYKNEKGVFSMPFTHEPVNKLRDYIMSINSPLFKYRGFENYIVWDEEELLYILDSGLTILNEMFGEYLDKMHSFLDEWEGVEQYVNFLLRLCAGIAVLDKKFMDIFTSRINPIINDIGLLKTSNLKILYLFLKANGYDYQHIENRYESALLSGNLVDQEAAASGLVHWINLSEGIVQDLDCPSDDLVNILYSQFIYGSIDNIKPSLNFLIEISAMRHEISDVIMEKILLSILRYERLTDYQNESMDDGKILIRSLLSKLSRNLYNNYLNESNKTKFNAISSTFSNDTLPEVKNFWYAE